MMGIGSPSCFIHDAWKLTELVRWSAGRSVVQIHFHFPLARWIHSAYNHVERYSWKAYGHVILKTMDASKILLVLPQLYIFTLNFKHNTLGLGIKTQLSPTHLNVSCASWINSVSYLLALCWAQFLKSKPGWGFDVQMFAQHESDLMSARSNRANIGTEQVQWHSSRLTSVRQGLISSSIPIFVV